MSETTCRGCGRKVVFATDENGKRQILDVVSPCYEITQDDFEGRRCARRKTTYVSHFATCPKASEFSKPKEPKT
jgi:hypothetical protein